MKIADSDINNKGLIGEALNAKWKVYHLMLSLLMTPYYLAYFMVKGVGYGKRWRLYGNPIIHKYRGSNVLIGDDFTNRNWFASNPVGIDHPTFLTTWNKNSEIIIGNNVGISGGIICAFEKVMIGDNTMIGANARIMDTDFHPIDPKTRRHGKEDVNAKAVTIGENVLIGANSLVLKGVTIGDNSIIGANSLVVNDIPANCIAGGNPAKVIKEIQI